MRCIANDIIKRSRCHFGEVESLGPQRERWHGATKALFGKFSGPRNLDCANHRLVEILRACALFRNIIIEGCFDGCQSSRVSEAWVDVRPTAVCGRLDHFVDRCRALQTALVDALDLQSLPGIEITGTHARMLTTGLSIIGRDVSIALSQFLAKAKGAPEALLDLENTVISVAIDAFSNSVMDFDQRLELFISQGIDLSNDIFECFEFTECLGAVARRSSAERSLASKFPVIADKYKSELQTVDALFNRGCTPKPEAEAPNFGKHGAGVNMPPVVLAVMWAQGLSKRIDVARQAFDLLIGKFGSAYSGAATEVAALRAESDTLVAQLLAWRTQKVEDWSQHLTVSSDDLKGPLLRRKNAAASTAADKQSHLQYQVVVNLPKQVAVFAREVKCACPFRCSGLAMCIPVLELISLLCRFACVR